MKKYVSLFIAFLTIFSLCGCGAKTEITPSESESYATTETPTTTITYNSEETMVAVIPSSTAPTTTEVKKEPSTLNIPTTSTQPSTKKETAAPTTLEATIQKTGEMAFSDSADNRYIKAISEKYGVNAQLLVALYTVPENDSNIVLQFDGSTDANGTLIRNKDSLVAIYTIDKSLNSKCASEDKNLNEYPYGEMKVIYFSTTKYIMPEFSELK